MQQILQDIQRDENRQRDYGQASKQDDRQKSFSRSEATLGASRKDPFVIYHCRNNTWRLIALYHIG